MKPMPVRNPATVHRILEDLIELSETDMDTLIKKYEMDPELIDQLRKRPARDIINVASHPERLGIVIAFQDARIIGHFKLNDMRDSDAEDFEYFVRNGAG